MDLRLNGKVAVMIRQKSGSIVCLGSDAGKTGGQGEIIYAAAKGALMTFAKGLTKEAGPHGVRINVVNAALTRTPGMMASAFLTPESETQLVKDFPLGRLGRPQDLVDAIVLLASDRAGFITGQTLSVSGGRV
jgi:2-hydroxycyclohexanecarboxyl-CoA dehydrogenase